MRAALVPASSNTGLGPAQERETEELSKHLQQYYDTQLTQMQGDLEAHRREAELERQEGRRAEASLKKRIQELHAQLEVRQLFPRSGPVVGRGRVVATDNRGACGATAQRHPLPGTDAAKGDGSRPTDGRRSCEKVLSRTSAAAVRRGSHLRSLHGDGAPSYSTGVKCAVKCPPFPTLTQVGAVLA